MKKRTPLIGGNWKMHKDPGGTTSFFERFLPLVERSAHCEIVICPSFLDVENAVTATRGTKIQIGHTGPLLGERGRVHRRSLWPHDQSVRLLACDRRAQ